ncbi:MAG: hypothetical protein ACT4PY_15080 [Armatimonadota bacterium]
MRRHGVDPTLEELAKGGVYFTSDEFKGKRTVERGTTAFRVTPADFLPQASSPGFATVSSGTVNRPVRSFITLGWLAQRALAVAVALSAHGLLERAHAIFDGIFPAGGGVNRVDPGNGTRGPALLHHHGRQQRGSDRTCGGADGDLARGPEVHRDRRETVWKLAGTIRIRREEPYASPRRKTLPLHIPP